MDAPPSRERKRRKWDVTAPPSSQAPSAPPASGGSVQLDAAAIVARINAELMEKGVGAHKFAPVKVEPPKEFFREITFNDAPSAVRQQLTKRHCQEEIQRRTGTVLIVRGRYYPPGMPVDDRDKPLFLRISPTVAAGDTDEEKQRAVDAAAGEVQKILQGQQQVHRGAVRSGPPQGSYVAVQPGSYTAVPPPGQAAPASSYNAVPFPGQSQGPAVDARQSGTAGEVKVFVGFMAPPAFNLNSRLTGPAGGYLAHISREAGAQVSLQGRGATPSGSSASSDPLHILVAAPTPKAAEDARQLAQNLIDTTRAAAEKEFPNQVRQDGPMAGGGAPHAMYGAPMPHHYMPHHPMPYHAPGPYLHHRPMPPHYPAYPPPAGPFLPHHPTPPLQQPRPQPLAAPPPAPTPPQEPSPAVETVSAEPPPPKRRFSEGNITAEPPTPAQPTPRIQSPAPSVPMGPPPPRMPKTNLPMKPAAAPAVEQSADAGGSVLAGLVDYAGDEE